MSEQITISGGQLRITFSQFDLAGYDLFLRCKKLPEQRIEFDRATGTYEVTAPERFARLLGIDHSPPNALDLPMADHLWDYQRFLVETAMSAQRYAVWAECGLGKTAVFLEFARQVAHRTGERVLIISPKNVIEQTRDQAAEFYGPGFIIERLENPTALKAWCRGSGETRIGIANFEKFTGGVLDEIRYLAGVIIDEASILKTGGGVIKWNLIKSCRGIPYKLTCTATPAPNDTMEYASQASFLEKLKTETDILWTWFTRNKSGEWEVKPHAREDFFRFMSSWSIYMRNPGAYGFKDNIEPIPEPIFIKHLIDATEEQGIICAQLGMEDSGDFFANERMGIGLRSRLSQLAKGFIYGRNKKAIRYLSLKPVRVAEIVREDVAAGLQVMVWILFDEEGEILREMLEGINVEVLSGKTPASQRELITERFRRGQTTVLISKARLLGFGLNFQHCGSMVFSGFDDSFEKFYQAVRRAYRHGQTRRLRVHLPLIEQLEGKVFENVMAKSARFDEETRIQEFHYLSALRREVSA